MCRELYSGTAQLHRRPSNDHYHSWCWFHQCSMTITSTGLLELVFCLQQPFSNGEVKPTCLKCDTSSGHTGKLGLSSVYYNVVFFALYYTHRYNTQTSCTTTAPKQQPRLLFYIFHIAKLPNVGPGTYLKQDFEHISLLMYMTFYLQTERNRVFSTNKLTLQCTYMI